MEALILILIAIIFSSAAICIIRCRKLLELATTAETRADDLEKELVWACEIVYYSERFNGETSDKAAAILEREKGG